MIIFLAVAALLTLLVVAWMVRPLLRPAAETGVSSERLNATIYRDQLEALARDLARGSICPADYEATRDELQLRLLDDTEVPQTMRPSSAMGFWTPRHTAAAMAVLLPIASTATYGWLGNPAAVDPLAAQRATDAQVAQMVDTLAARLQANPDNPKGWAMLARSYKVLGRLPDAEQAILKTGNLVNTEPDLMVEYAELLAIRAGNSMEGKPLELINKALSLDPQNPSALMMSGVAAYQRSDFAAAVTQWEKLMAMLAPGSTDALKMAADIDDARLRAGMLSPADATTTAAGSMSPERINQMVERLAARLKNTPDDLAGWARLGRAYWVQGRLAEAEDAYTKAGKLLEGNPNLLTQYADLLAVRAGNSLEGRPLALVNKALALDEKHPQALMMAGSAAFQRADYAQAIAHWEKVLTVLAPSSRDAKLVVAEIADARAKAGQSLQPKTQP